MSREWTRIGEALPVGVQDIINPVHHCASQSATWVLRSRDSSLGRSFSSQARRVGQEGEVSVMEGQNGSMSLWRTTSYSSVSRLSLDR